MSKLDALNEVFRGLYLYAPEALVDELRTRVQEYAAEILDAKPSLGQRFETLTARATRQIAEARRLEIQRHGQAILDELISRQAINNTEELFYLLAFDALVSMTNYAEDLQAELGGEILRKALEGGPDAT
jgi:hypothetical protein